MPSPAEVKVISTRVEPGDTTSSPCQPEVNTSPVRWVDLDELPGRLHALAHADSVCPARYRVDRRVAAHPLDVLGRVVRHFSSTTARNAPSASLSARYRRLVPCRRSSRNPALRKTVMC